MISEDDNNNIKIIKHQLNQLNELKNSMNSTSKIINKNISEVESLLQTHKIDLSVAEPTKDEKLIAEAKNTSGISSKSYAELLEDAENALGKESVFGFEDILSSDEIMRAFSRVDEIEWQFSKITGIFNKIDISFLLIATALQAVKWILFPRTEFTDFGKTFNPNDRLNHDDPEIKTTHKRKLKESQLKHQKEDGTWCWEMRKNDVHPKTWSEILFSKVPYDYIKGAGNIEGLNINGQNHRLKTLGHDPILGWIFGTANILTDTITFTDMRSYRVDKMILNIPVPIQEIFCEATDLTIYDWHCLAAAIVAQGAHLASDEFTKRGLPVPMLSLFNPELASKLYDEHYDALCFARDMKTIGNIGLSAIVSALINLIISIIHGLFYSPDKDGISREIYEIRTRKIILISNALASGSNILYSCLSKDLGKLDIGGILVTIGRLFNDARFILRIKEEFVQNEIDKDLRNEINRLDVLYTKIIGV